METEHVAEPEISERNTVSHEKKEDNLIKNLIKTLTNLKKYKNMDLVKFRRLISSEFINIHRWRNKEKMDIVKKTNMHTFTKNISILDWVALSTGLYEKEDFRTLLKNWYTTKHEQEELPSNFTGVTCRVNFAHLFYGKDDILSEEGAYCAGPFNIEFSEDIYDYIINSWSTLFQTIPIENIKIPKTKDLLYGTIFEKIYIIIDFFKNEPNNGSLSRMIQLFLESSAEYWTLSPSDIIEFFDKKEEVKDKLINMNAELQKVFILYIYIFELYLKSR